jgi:hypothetical protein
MQHFFGCIFFHRLKPVEKSSMINGFNPMIINLQNAQYFLMNMFLNHASMLPKCPREWARQVTPQSIAAPLVQGNALRLTAKHTT